MRNYYFIFTVLAVVLCNIALGQVELPESEKLGLIGPANPALVGIDRLYVILSPSEDKPSKDGLVWDELQKKVERKLEKAGITIAAGVHLGKGQREHDIPEFRIQMEMLKFADSGPYVFRLQTSLAVKVYLERQKVFFKADAWQTKPLIQAVPPQTMPDEVTHAVLTQLEAFIVAWDTANPLLKKSSDANDVTAEAKVKDVLIAESQETQCKFVASKNSHVFHKPDCISAGRIKPANIVNYNTRTEAINAGKKPCMRCKP